MNNILKGQADSAAIAAEQRRTANESTYGDCSQCGFPLDPNGDCGTNITHNY